MDASTTSSAPKKSLGDAWAAQMKSRFSNELESQEVRSQIRVEGAKGFVSNEVRKLQRWIKKIGTVTPAGEANEGKYQCNFGELFKATMDDMQAVSSTLKTARRLDIVAYDGEHLLQGSSDSVLIHLLQEDDSAKLDVVVKDRGNLESDIETDPFKIDGERKIVPCWRCGKDVFPADRVGVDGGKVLHRGCFECWLDE
jgi:hypothetical protein